MSDALPLWPAPLDDPPGPPRKRRRGLLLALVAGAVVLVVLAGGGAVAAVKMWTGSGGTLPEAVVPASTAAFVRVNLTPGIGQRIKFDALLKKVPGASVGDLERRLFNELRSPVPYDEVKPWFDERAGLGLWSDAQKQPVVLVALATNDAAKARSTLTAARDKAGTDKLGFVVAGGYALLARAEKGSQAAAEAAAKAAKAGSLAHSAGFRAASAGLPADQALLSWVDVGQAGALYKTYLTAQLKAVDPSITATGDAMMPGLEGLKGHIVIGAVAADNGIELHGRAVGLDAATSATVKARQRLDELPGNSAAAMALSGGLGDLTTAVGPLTGLMLPGMAFGDPDLGADPDFGAGSDPADDETGELSDELTPEEEAAAEAVGKADDALSAALGAARSLTVALTGFSMATGPTMRLTIELPDEAAAKKLRGDVAALPDLTAAQTGDRVDLQSKNYRAEAGTLADSALYREAMAGVPADATSAGYLDVQKLVSALPAEVANQAHLGPVKAIGFGTSRSGTDLLTMGRIVIG
jgi:hypothetical protein